MPPLPEIVLSRRFTDAYQGSSALLQWLVEGAVRDFVNRVRSQRKTLTRHYDRVEGLRGLLEVDVAGGPRLLASFDQETLTLLDMGGHEVVSRYSARKLHADLSGVEPAPEWFWP